MEETKTLPKADYTPAKLDEVSKRLMLAANLMEKRGLTKNTTCDTDGRLCVRGALMAASGTATLKPYHIGLAYYWDDADPIAIEADKRLFTSLGTPSYAWNNEGERTVGEVVSKLRAVALGG